MPANSVTRRSSSALPWGSSCLARNGHDRLGVRDVRFAAVGEIETGLLNLSCPRARRALAEFPIDIACQSASNARRNTGSRWHADRRPLAGGLFGLSFRADGIRRGIADRGSEPGLDASR